MNITVLNDKISRYHQAHSNKSIDGNGLMMSAAFGGNWVVYFWLAKRFDIEPHPEAP